MLSVHNLTGLFLPTSGRRRLLCGDGLTEHWTGENTCAVTTYRVIASCSASPQDTSFYCIIFVAPSQQKIFFPTICHCFFCFFQNKMFSFKVDWVEWLNLSELALTGMFIVINMCYCSFIDRRHSLMNPCYILVDSDSRGRKLPWFIPHWWNLHPNANVLTSIIKIAF